MTDKPKGLLPKSVTNLFNTSNLLKILYKPHKIPGAIKEIYHNAYTYYSDIKFKPTPHEYTLNVYNQSLHGLGRLADKNCKSPLRVLSVTDYISKGTNESEFASILAALFKSYGSDKSTTHDYYLIYAEVLRNILNDKIKILEIGLGTNNIDTLSNMGVDGKPGASLRAFRDACKNASVYGADIDKRILFQEDRIQTFFLDQTQPDSFEELRTKLEHSTFDLIIDDGLHNSQAHINTLNFELNLLGDSGIFIIEDININDFNYYKIISAILEKSQAVFFIQMKSACLSVIKRN